MAEDPIQSDDKEYEPSAEPKSSKAWLNLIKDAETAFADFQTKADDIDRLYADLKRLANNNRDREFQLFWANCEVLKPSIYARPPVPVVVPKFKDRRSLPRVSSELLERSTNTAFDLADINSTMILLRDDVAVVGRGSPWVRYETKKESDRATEQVCIEHKDRRDFLHDPARKWQEVGWVAVRAYLTRLEMKDRFEESSRDAWAKASYAVLREDRNKGAANNQQKAAVWEIWSKSENKVVWVTEGVEELLDEGEPHLKLEGFFPCPKPAYATVQRGSLVPVPDMLFYKDQLEEINQLTARIHALADALRVKGFYPAGGEIGDAVETALTITDDRKVMVPVSNFAAFGQGGDPIIWLPIDMVATTLQGVVELRRQVIDDVYQIMGLSDIMRGSTEKDETATAQNLKAQYGSVRIRDKQAELVRVARDLVRITAEIMAENFDKQTLLDMSQMEMPTNAEISKQIKELENRAKQIAATAEKTQRAMQKPLPPEAKEQAQGQEQQAQQALQAAQQEIQQIDQQVSKLEQTPTIEKVMAYLRDQKIRPFALDIETDSTIQPDEDAEKQRRTEFMGAFMQSAQALTEMLMTVPQAAPLAGEMLRFVLAPYRAGRQMEGAIDDFVDQMVAQASQPKPNPEEMAQQAEAQRAQAEMTMKQQELQGKQQIEMTKLQAEQQGREQDAQFKARENQAKLIQIDAQMRRDEQKGALEIQKLQMELEAKHEELAIKRESAQIDAASKMQQANISAQSAQQQADIKAQQAEQQAVHSEAAFEQKTALANQQKQANGAV